MELRIILVPFMLEVQDLTVSYQGVRVLNRVSFQAQPGQRVGLFGPNGAGKSTLLKAMLGLIPKTIGSVKFGNRPLHQQRQQVAYIPQRSQIDWDYPITVRNVVLMARTVPTGWFRQPSRQSQELAQTALERVGMWELRHRPIGKLSGGQQQRVFLARALAQQAELFLFDEPCQGIDKATEAILFDIFSELKLQNKTLIIVSHDLSLTLNQYDYFLLLNQQLIASGTPDQVLTPTNLEKAYGCGFNFKVA